MSNGYIKLHRKLFDNKIWLSEPFTKAQAWVDILGLCNHKDNYFFKRGVKINVPRGNLAWSEEALAKRWRWSRGKVRRLLGMLKNEQMIEQQKSSIISQISVINYEEYQGNGTANGTTDSTTDGQQTDTNNKEKKDKNIKERKNKKKEKLSKSAYTEDFEMFWYHFPRRGSETKRLSFEAWLQALDLTDTETLIAAAKKYSDDKQVKDGYGKMATTWLNQCAWENYDWESTRRVVVKRREKENEDARKDRGT